MPQAMCAKLRFHLSLLLLLLFTSACDISRPGELDGSGAETFQGDSRPENFHFAQAVEIGLLPVDQATAAEILAQTADLGLVQRISGGRRPLLLENGVPTAIAHNPYDSGDWHGGVLATSAVGVFFTDGQSLTYRWTFPSAPNDRTVVDLFLNQRDSMTVPVSGNTIEIRFRFQGGGWSIDLNGQSVANDWGGPVFYIPYFRSTSSGSHAIEVIADGGSRPTSGVWTYNQKNLRFTEEFPEYDLGSSQPIEIMNSFEWDNGTPLVAPAWSVAIENSYRKADLGTNIAATWSPQDLVLSQNSNPRNQIQLRELNYRVRAETQAYPADSTFPATTAVVSRGGGIPGRRGELRIINTTLTPDPPFEEPDSSVTLNAQVVVIGSTLSPSRIEWTVDLKDAEGNVVVESIAMGTGPEIAAIWDGKIQGEAAEESGEYSFEVRAQLCESGNASAQRMSSGGFRAQASGECLYDSEVALLSFSSEYLEVTVTPDQIPPSNLHPGKTETVDVQVRLLKMPPGRDSLKVNLKSEVYRDRSDSEADLTHRGGHNHDESSRPPATFATNSYRFSQPGVFTTKLRVGDTGARLKIRAIPDEPSLKHKSAFAHLSVAVPDLVRLPMIPPTSTFSGYYLVGGAGVDNQDNPGGSTSAHSHPSNHWGTHDLIAAIDEVSTNYMHFRIEQQRKLNPNWNAVGSNVKVLVNDMSLRRGGLFDVGGNWTPSHYEHRNGTEVDMITERDPNDIDLVRFWRIVTKKSPLVHDGRDGLPLHIHGRVE